jgi:lysozyme
VAHYYNNPVGNCTYGAGILAHGRTPYTAVELGQPVTQAQMDAAFNTRIGDAERAVRRNVRSQQLTQAQFDSLVSLTYNAGPTGARGTFTLVEAGNLQGTADNMMQMVYGTAHTARGTRRVLLPGLVTRRQNESAPFRVPAQQPQPNQPPQQTQNPR